MKKFDYLPDNSLPSIVMQEISMSSDGAEQGLASRFPNCWTLINAQLPYNQGLRVIE